MQWQYLFQVLRITLANRIQIVVMIQQTVNNSFAVRNEQKRKAARIYEHVKQLDWWLMVASIMDIISQLYNIQFGKLNNLNNYVESIMQWRTAIVCPPIFVLIPHIYLFILILYIYWVFVLIHVIYCMFVLIHIY